MKKRIEKEDQLLADIMKDFSMENPSEGFTDRVMQSIEMESNIEKFKPSPLISKAGWIGIAASLAVLVVILFTAPQNQVPAESSWLSEIIPTLNFPSFEISFSDLLSSLKFNSPALFWIFIGVAGIALLALLERFLESFNPRQSYLV